MAYNNDDLSLAVKLKEGSFNQGLDFILSHFQESLWPRAISTHLTEGRQILVFNKEEAVARFKQSNFLDCRISAYPSYTVQ